MATKVILPKVDMDQETGTVVEWLKQDGDLVEKGDPILIIETDKVAVEVESPASGILQGIQAEADEIIPIGTIIAYILEPGEELPDEAKSKDVPAPSRSTAVAPAAAQSDVTATPVARNIAATHDITLVKIAGTGSRGKVTRRDVQTAMTSIPADRTGDGKVYATPAARRTAREREVDLTIVTGSGPRGRIQAANVLAAATNQVEVAPVPIPKAAPRPEVEVIPLQGMRRTIAERMTVSYQTTPHITLTTRVDMSQFEETRAQLNVKAEATGESRVTVTALLVKAVASALRRHPYLNSLLKDDGIHLLPESNIGVAVALAEGLIVPVIHNVAQKGIGEIAGDVNDLATRARKGQLKPVDVAAGTFTISNLGPFGIEQFTAIINPPQAAILTVGTTRLEAVHGEEDRVIWLPVMRMTLSADHRIVDGAMAARFLAELRDVLESPVMLLW